MKKIWFISFFTNIPTTGPHCRLYFLGKELAKQGCQISLFPASYTHIAHHEVDVAGDYLREETDGMTINWIKTAHYKHAHSASRIVNTIKYSYKICRLAEEFGPPPDVIYVSSPALMSHFAGEYLAKKFDAKLVFEVRDIWPLTLIELGGYSRWHPAMMLMQMVEDRAYKKADVVVSNLPNADQHMIQRGMDETKFRWIGNGYFFEVSQKKSLVNRKSLGLRNEDFCIGYAGTFGKANALEYLIDAAEILQLENFPAQIVLLGGGKDQPELEASISFKKLQNVHLYERVPKKEVQAFLANMDVLYIAMLDSPLYRFGVAANKLFDYFAAQKPIIWAGNAGDYRPVTDAGAGLSVPPEDGVALADAIKKIYYLSEEEKQRMGANGLSYGLANHSYSTLAIRLADEVINDVSLVQKA